MWNTYRRVHYTIRLPKPMPRKRRWSNEQLQEAVKESFSFRDVISRLGLIPAGGNYQQVQSTIKEMDIDVSHFTGKGWRKNRKFEYVAKVPLEELLVKHSNVQSFKLKRRLFLVGLKKPECEICNWAERSLDGRIPVELDHVNGDRFDNRIENLRILCPNCHSLQSTHRGRNQKSCRRGGGIGRHATLKML